MYFNKKASSEFTLLGWNGLNLLESREIFYRLCAYLIRQSASRLL
jgi:hypothetical protein